MMTKYFQKRSLESTLFGCRNIDRKIYDFQGELAKLRGKRTRESALFGNTNLCLDSGLLADDLSKAKLIMGAGFSNSQDSVERATHLCLPGNSNSFLLSLGLSYFPEILLLGPSTALPTGLALTLEVSQSVVRSLACEWTPSGQSPVALPGIVVVLSFSWLN